jgi:branched-chain amino acid transport system substrate-binding protein
LQAAGIYVVFVGGYHRETGLIFREARDRGYNLELIANSVARFRAEGYDPPGFTLYAYAAVQVWAQAVEAAGSLDLDAVTLAMHSRQFDTVLGRIGFDTKGDVTGFEPWQWYVWQADGTYLPLEPSITAKQ